MVNKNNPWKTFKELLYQLFDLHEDKESEYKTIESISKGVEFRGTNLWILIFAILIASIGLNVNSPAVVIGAMLISPLMGPIMGIGLGAGIIDFELIKKSMRNLAIAVGISVLTSTIYFAITPLHEAQSELLARTYPTLWDVLIAFFGGLAGIVAGSRKEKSNAIPGVAIATALMPPLCTAGYGLANLNWYYFAGAFYLFFINSVFISFGTYLIVRFLNYPKRQFEDEKTARLVKRSIAFFVIITIIPSTYLAYHLVQRTLFEQNAKNFVATEFNFKSTDVINSQFNYGTEKSNIEVTLYGKPLTSNELEGLNEKLTSFGLDDTELKVKQGYVEEVDRSGEFELMSSQIKVDIIEELYTKNEELLKTKDDRITFLEKELALAKGAQYPTKALCDELKIHHPNLTEFSITDMISNETASNMPDTFCLAVAKFNRRPSQRERKQIEEWLKLRVAAEDLRLIVQ